MQPDGRAGEHRRDGRAVLAARAEAMKIGVFTVLYHELPLEEALDRIAAQGVEAIEISTGNYAGSSHCDPQTLLADSGAARRFKDSIERRGLVISGLSQHGNPLHPREEI